MFKAFAEHEIGGKIQPAAFRFEKIGLQRRVIGRIRPRPEFDGALDCRT
jgi:hypothetical protein